MKRVLIVVSVVLTTVIALLFLTLRIWIGQGIKERIEIAKEKYPGKAEDSLIAYLNDSTISPDKRTDVAIWTLGQIRSTKALPVLQAYYKDDPAGKTCKGQHDEVLCQYELHKAIVSIEHGWLGAREKNWFGSWAKFNK